MRILLITHIFPPAVDGGSKVIAKMGEYLSLQGHEIIVLTSNCRSTDDFVHPISEDQKIKTTENQKIFRLPVYHRLRRPLKALSILLPKKSYLRQLLEVFQKGPIFRFLPLFSFLVSSFLFRPDYIIAGPLPTTMVLYARIIRSLYSILTHQRTKLIINASYHPTDPDFQKLPLINSLKSADLIWTLTDFESNYFNQQFDIPKAELLKLGNGIDPNFILHTPRSPEHQSSNNLLFIGSLAIHKNLTVLIKAFEILSPLYPSLSLTIAGQKTLSWPQFETQIENLPSKIKNKIKLIFNFPDNLSPQLYDQATILIQPSLQESFGLTLIEAWARQIPVIASDIPQFSEIITKTQGGLIFNKDSPYDLSEKISKLINNQNLRHKLASNGHSYVKKYYLWDKIALSLCQKLSISSL